MRLSGVVILLATLTAWPAGAYAACGGDFDAWLQDFKADAAAQGVSQRAINAGLKGLTPDPAILKLDRNQHYFKQSFETYRAKRVPPGRIAAGATRLKQSAAFFNKLEAKYGVPGAVLVAIWGLETGFGGFTGNTPVLRSLATLAHDCRRADFFRNELISALKIVDHGDLSPSEMKGGWAGELGQTQFLPSSYVKFAVDGDGNGRRDLIHSYADALASTANYLKGYGWQAGQPFGEGTANFAVLTGWNKAEVYRKTIVWYAKAMQNYR